MAMLISVQSCKRNGDWSLICLFLCFQLHHSGLWLCTKCRCEQSNILPMNKVLDLQTNCGFHCWYTMTSGNWCENERKSNFPPKIHQTSIEIMRLLILTDLRNVQKYLYYTELNVVIRHNKANVSIRISHARSHKSIQRKINALTL